MLYVRHLTIGTGQIQPPSSLPSLLNLCKTPHHLHQIHARFILHGLQQNTALSSKLIESYTNLGHRSATHQVFSSVTNPNATLYNTFLTCLSKFDDFEKTLLVYDEMVAKSMCPDESTYPLVFRACSQLRNGLTGKRVHRHLMKLGFDLYDKYMGCSDSGIDHQVFDEMTVNVNGNASHWNPLMFEAFANGYPAQSFELFNRMRMEGVEPNSVTMINLLRATVNLNSQRVGGSVHSLILVSCLCEDLAVSTALLTMYSKLGCTKDARLLFDQMPERDCVVWNLMISAYSRSGYHKESVELLMKMMRSGVRGDLFTAIPTISSIAELKSLSWGKQLHAHVIRNGSDYQVSVHNALINMYCECNCLEAAQIIFDTLTNKTVVSWSAMIKGYVNHNHFSNALSLFMKMKMGGFAIDSVIVINVLPAFVNLGALDQVNRLHAHTIKCALNSSYSVNTSFLVSYAKCGCIELARKIFDEEEVDSKDIITWNSMINGYSKHGDWYRCRQLYNQMKQSKIKPDHVTFLGLLTVCVNSGHVDEGRQFFKDMTETYGYQPKQEHYACMVDLLGRAGKVKEASELIKTMTCKPDARVWGPLLCACKLHPDTKIAELAAEKLVAMEPRNAGNYVLLSNIYAAAGKWDKVSKMRTFLRDKGLKKVAGCSWLEINGRVHEFTVADRSHPNSVDMCAILKNIEWDIKGDEES